jgi:hypothetical protein
MNLKKTVRNLIESKYFDISIIISFIIIASIYRFLPLLNNYSFWADEAFVSSVARDLIQGKIQITNLFSTLGAVYQTLHVALIAISFYFFGITESVARYPSAIFGIIGVPFIYIVTKKWSGRESALISTFLYTFSQLQLAHATQAKPYAAISTLFLVLIYLLQLISDNKKSGSKLLLLHIGALVTLFAMYLLHVLSVLFGIVYLIFIFKKYGSRILTREKFLPVLGGIALLIVLSVFYVFSIGLFPANLLSVNNTVYFREFLFHQYFFLTVSSVFGAWILRGKYPAIFLGILIWSVALLFFWTFIHYSRNIRYLLPLFTVMQIFFGVFWSQVFAKFFPHKKFLLSAFFIILLFVGWDKVVRKPAVYYSPNKDIFSDVQNANYKEAYKFIEENFKDYNKIAVFNNIIDVQKYYLPKKEVAEAYFMKGIVKPQKHPVNNAVIYGTLSDFINEKSKYNKGIIIVEDWESFLPEDIKQYAKKNMKLEYRIESLEVSPTDKWPIEIYSWGMEEK